MGMLNRALSSVESFERVDRPAERLQRWVRRALPDGRVARIIRGERVGHPLHPIAMLLPLGSWLSATVLDLMPNQEEASRRLVLTGLIGTVPAVTTGLAEFRDLSQSQRRVGYVHAAVNGTAVTCFLMSYRHRTQGRIGTGRLWGAVGMAVVGIGGALGGHLAYAQGVGVFRWQERAHEPEAPRPEAQDERAEAPGVPVATGRS